MRRTVSIGVVAIGVACRASPAPATSASTPPPAFAATPTPASTVPSTPPSSSSAPTASTPVPSAATPPRDPEQCKSCNGIWTRGLSGVGFCNCRTHDSGKRCRDGADCEGVCVLASQPERETVEAGPPPRGFYVGSCSELVTEFGCFRVLARGASAGGPKPFDNLPAMLCVD